MLQSNLKDLNGIEQVKILFMGKAKQLEVDMIIIKFETITAYHLHIHLTKARETKLYLLIATHTAFLN